MSDVKELIRSFLSKHDNGERADEEVRMLREYLESLEHNSEENITTVITEYVCQITGVNKDDIKTKNKNGDVVFARHVIASEVFKYTSFNFRMIGNVINRSHSDVIYIINTSVPSYETSFKYRVILERIRETVRDRFKNVQVRGPAPR